MLSIESRNRFSPLAGSEEMPSPGRVVARKAADGNHDDCPGVDRVFRSPNGHLYDFFTCRDSDTVSLAMQKSMEHCNATIAYEPIRWNWWPFPIKSWWTWGAALSLYSQAHYVPDDADFLKCIDIQGQAAAEEGGQLNLRRAAQAWAIILGVVGGALALGAVVYGAALCVDACGDIIASRRERRRYDEESGRGPTERSSLLG